MPLGISTETRFRKGRKYVATKLGPWMQKRPEALYMHMFLQKRTAKKKHRQHHHVCSNLENFTWWHVGE